VDYARNRSDVKAISLSWVISEFPGESNYDSHFISPYGAIFFANSGDHGTGVAWPAVSSNIVGVGGTNLTFYSNGSLASETAWNGSGGGLSAYEPEPSYQTNYVVPNANGMRAVPDVSYNADMNSSFSVYENTVGWEVVWGTSAGAPQWAAIQALGLSASNENFYKVAKSKSYSSYFRDITTGSNGNCGFYCTAVAGYDYVTGLGSPLSITYTNSILSYYRGLGNDPTKVETTDLLKAADDWSNNRIVDGFTNLITTQQLLSLADEWSRS
jgi:hypothetical protein